MNSFTPDKIILTAKKRDLFLLENDGKLVGTIGLDKSRISDFFIAPDQQTKGIGSILLRHVEELAKDNGVRSLQLSASITAVRFYRKRGYEPTGEQEDGPFGRTVGMRKLLS
jgi:GNAT superfamily N-acetyltransferase